MTIEVKNVPTGYKITEYGYLPSEWDLIELGKVMNFLNGRAFKPQEWGNEGLPIIRIQNLNGSTDFNYYKGNYSEKNYIEKGQLLFSWSGSRGTSFGPFFWESDAGLLNQHIFKVELIDGLEKLYAYYALKNITVRIEREAHGSAGLVHVTKKTLENFSIPVPPANEQKKIAEILSTADKQIENTEQLIQKTKELKKGLMQKLLTKGIGHTEFKQTEIGEIPVEWEVSKIGESCTVIMGQSPKGDSYNNLGEGTPLLNGPTEFGERFPTAVQWTSSPTKFCQDRDILFCVRGSSIGRMNISNGVYCIGRGLAAIRQSNNTFTSYISYLLEYQIEKVLKNSSGSTFPNITRDELLNVSLPLPHLEEQKDIAEILSTVDEQVEAYEQEKAKQIELKKGLMQQLLTGKIRVTV